MVIPAGDPSSVIVLLIGIIGVVFISNLIGEKLMAVNLKGQSADEILNDQPTLVAEGHYLISAVWYQPNQYDGEWSHKIKWQIVGSPPHLESERGKYLYSNWNESKPSYAKQFLKAGVACGIYTEAQVRDWVAAGEMPDPDFEQWLGHKCVCKVTHNEWQGKTYANIGFDWFAVESDTAKEAGIVAGEKTPF